MSLEYQFTTADIVTQGRTTYDHIESICLWLSKSDNENVPQKIQEEMIALFLLSCNNDVNLTKKTVIAYYNCKKNAPEIFDDRDLNRKDIQTALNTIYMCSIPVRTEENHVIHYFKLNDPSTQNFDLSAIMKISYMLVDIAQEKNPPDGLIVVIDMKGLGLMHMTKLKLGALKKYLQFLQEGFPMQLKVIHILNAVYFMDKLMSIIKVFMKSELMNMLHIHPPNLEKEKLFNILPKKYLPKDYGGDLPSAKDLNEITLKQLKAKQKFWDIEEGLRKDISNSSN